MFVYALNIHSPIRAAHSADGVRDQLHCKNLIEERERKTRAFQIGAVHLRFYFSPECTRTDVRFLAIMLIP